MTFREKHGILTQLSQMRETHKHKTTEKIKKLLTSFKRCDKLIKLSKNSNNKDFDN